jgi:hypothetical protein
MHLVTLKTQIGFFNMKYIIEYSGGPPDRVWHGQVIVEAEDAAQAIHKVENEMACIPASIDAVNPKDEE